MRPYAIDGSAAVSGSHDARSPKFPFCVSTFPELNVANVTQPGSGSPQPVLSRPYLSTKRRARRASLRPSIRRRIALVVCTRRHGGGANTPASSTPACAPTALSVSPSPRTSSTSSCTPYEAPSSACSSSSALLLTSLNTLSVSPTSPAPPLTSLTTLSASPVAPHTPAIPVAPAPRASTPSHRCCADHAGVGNLRTPRHTLVHDTPPRNPDHCGAAHTHPSARPPGDAAATRPRDIAADAAALHAATAACVISGRRRGWTPCPHHVITRG